MRQGSGNGSGHWLVQRISAVALVPLGLWFIFSLSTRADLSRDAWLAFVAEPLHAGALILFLLTLFFHSYLGVQVVIEDYVHHRPRELALLIVSRVLHAAAAVLGVYAVLNIALGVRV
jgi:succinate dehydrogenase / fumarate reductase, membrane anchor subunit